jgi:hypothetical protein
VFYVHRFLLIGLWHEVSGILKMGPARILGYEYQVNERIESLNHASGNSPFLSFGTLPTTPASPLFPAQGFTGKQVGQPRQPQMAQPRSASTVTVQPSVTVPMIVVGAGAGAAVRVEPGAQEIAIAGQ